MSFTRLPRYSRLLAICAVTLLGVAVAAPASAHGFNRGGPRVSFSFGFGAPYYPYWYYPPRVYYPYSYPYYATPVVVAPAAPTTYVEQPPPPAQHASPAPSHYWHYCAESNAYYPYVQQCAGGWQQVSPTPPGR